MINKMKREETKRIAEKLLSQDLRNYSPEQKNKILSEAKRQVIMKFKVEKLKSTEQSQEAPKMEATSDSMGIPSEQPTDKEEKEYTGITNIGEPEQENEEESE